MGTGQPGDNYTLVQYSTVQYSIVQYSTVQYSTVGPGQPGDNYTLVRYSTVQYTERWAAWWQLYTCTLPRYTTSCCLAGLSHGPSPHPTHTSTLSQPSYWITKSMTSSAHPSSGSRAWHSWACLMLVGHPYMPPAAARPCYEDLLVTSIGNQAPQH